MTSFIENIYDEINLTMIREDKKIPLNSIGKKKCQNRNYAIDIKQAYKQE